MSGDLISRSEVLAALSSRLSIVDMIRVAEIVESVPAVEAEPVVRCKDCDFGEICQATWDKKVWCGCWKLFQPQNGFCHRGERRAEEK